MISTNLRLSSVSERSGINYGGNSIVSFLRMNFLGIPFAIAFDFWVLAKDDPEMAKTWLEFSPSG